MYNMAAEIKENNRKDSFENIKEINDSKITTALD